MEHDLFINKLSNCSKLNAQYKRFTKNTKSLNDLFRPDLGESLPQGHQVLHLFELLLGQLVEIKLQASQLAKKEAAEFKLAEVNTKSAPQCHDKASPEQQKITKGCKENMNNKHQLETDG